MINATIWARRAMLMMIVCKVDITPAIVVDKVMELNITNGVTTLHRLPRHHMNNLSATILDKHVIEIVIVAKAVLTLVRLVVAARMMSIIIGATLLMKHHDPRPVPTSLACVASHAIMIPIASRNTQVHIIHACCAAEIMAQQLEHDICVLNHQRHLLPRQRMMMIGIELIVSLVIIRTHIKEVLDAVYLVRFVSSRETCHARLIIPTMDVVFLLMIG